MNDIRIGNGYDVHALGPGLPLMLGGVRVESPVGCIAHSDGDVAIHALCDALLGALALGDIGKHFPDTSDEFKGIDSKILLQRTMSLVKEKGYGVCNVDITIAMQRPKLAPYITEMRETLARIMGTDISRVSVKRLRPRPPRNSASLDAGKAAKSTQWLCWQKNKRTCHFIWAGQHMFPLSHFFLCALLFLKTGKSSSKLRKCLHGGARRLPPDAESRIR